MTGTTTITDGTTTWTPELLLGYEVDRASRNVIHQLLNPTAGIVADVRAAGKRSGTLEALFLVESDATSFENGLSAVKTFTLADSAVASIGMTFILRDRARQKLDRQGRKRWTVEFGFQEI